MSTQLKLRRGTTAQHSTFTGAEGEVTVDTTKDTLVIHNGTTAGGIPLATEASVTTLSASTTTSLGTKLNAANPSYTGTLTGGTDVVNLGSGQFYKDASGHVGLGTSSLTPFVGSKKLVLGSGSGNAIFTLYGGNATYSGLYFADGTTGNELYRGFIEYDHAADAMNFGTAGGTQARFTSAGVFQMNSGYGAIATAFGCRAWANFNGVGTVAIRASGNVSSITDNGTGDYTVNLTTAMPDANYAVTAQNAGDTTYGSYGVYLFQQATPTTSAFRLAARSNGGTYVDPIQVNVAIFR